MQHMARVWDIRRKPWRLMAEKASVGADWATTSEIKRLNRRNPSTAGTGIRTRTEARTFEHAGKIAVAVFIANKGNPTTLG